MKPIIIGIAGGSGSGKSTLAKNLCRALCTAVIITHDNYYKEDNPQTIDFNYDHPSAFDSELLAEHLRRLSRGECIDSPIYDYKRHKRSEETKRIRAEKYIILEGILIFHEKAILESLDLKIFVDTSEKERLERRIERDISERARTRESVISQFEKTVKPMHDLFVEPCRNLADLTVVGGGDDPESVERILERLNKITSEI